MYNVIITRKINAMTGTKFWLINVYKSENGKGSQVSSLLHNDIKKAFNNVEKFKEVHGDSVVVHYRELDGDNVVAERIETDGQIMAIILRDA